MCDKKNNVLFTDTTCVVLSPDFKLTDESHVLLKVPRKDNMYNIDLNNFVPQGGLTCLFAKATPDESNLWHRRLGHVNFKTMNKLVRGSLVRGLPSKLFEINQTCVAFQKGKQHKASCRKPALSFMRPFGCLVTILNTIDHLDALKKSMNYKPVVAGYQSNGSTGTKACDNASKTRMETIHGKDYVLLPLSIQDPPFSFSSKDSPDAGFKPSGKEEKKDAKDPGNESGNLSEEGKRDNSVDENIVFGCADDPNMPELEDIVYSDDDEDVGAEADINNLDAFMPVSLIPNYKVRILQKSQENGQNQTNKDTGTEEHTKRWENAIKSQQWSTQVNL
ncbi:ribonuclease H-like domain-containing protein [Tanacetum coccineum]